MNMTDLKVRVLWALVILLASTVTGLVGGILAVAGGAGLVSAVTTGAVSFGGAATLLLAFGVAFRLS